MPAGQSLSPGLSYLDQRQWLQENSKFKMLSVVCNGLLGLTNHRRSETYLPLYMQGLQRMGGHLSGRPGGNGKAWGRSGQMTQLSRRQPSMNILPGCTGLGDFIIQHSLPSRIGVPCHSLWAASSS